MDMIIWYDDDIGPSTNDRPEKGWYYLNPEHPATISKSGMYRATTPLLGLYDQRKETTAKQHLYWISALGCNVICVDWTNYTSYRTADSAGWKKYTTGTYLNGQNLLKTAASAEGFDVPKVSFYTNGGSGKVVHDLFYAFYVGGKYDSVWYKPAGRPLIIGVTRANKGTTDQGRPNYISIRSAITAALFPCRWRSIPRRRSSSPTWRTAAAAGTMPRRAGTCMTRSVPAIISRTSGTPPCASPTRCRTSS